MRTFLRIGLFSLIFSGLASVAMARGPLFSSGDFYPVTPTTVAASTTENCVDVNEAAAGLSAIFSEEGWTLSKEAYILEGKRAELFAELTGHPAPSVVHTMVIFAFADGTDQGRQPLGASLPFDADGCNVQVNGARVVESQGRVIGITTPFMYILSVLNKIEHGYSET